MSEIQIVRWSDTYAQAFIDLSVEWLEKYVSVEPADLRILHHPHEAVLDTGGMIFFALDESRPVGTIAMIPGEDGSLELAKLAVTEERKGQGIGSLLMQAALQYAEDQGVYRVILYTNRRLIPAIHLYQKFGFREAPLAHNKYLESDMMMELDLNREAFCIRPMREADYDAALALWRSVPGMGLRKLDDSREGIARFLRRNPTTCFVAERDGAVVGVILCGHDRRRGYIYHTAVTPDLRRRGIGARLVERALSALKQEQITRVCLNVLEQNTAAQRFWTQLGWEKKDFLGFYSKGISEADNAPLFEVETAGNGK